ncbi:MAG: cell surface protein SprA, partial [Bacteroidota bacterium]
MTKFSIAVLVSTFLSFFYTSPEGTVEDVQELEWASDTLVLSSLTNDPPPNDTSKTKKNPNDRRGDPTRQTRISPLHLDYPSNYSVDYRLKEDMEGYEIYERIGNTDIRYPSHISFEDYLEYNRKKKASEFFREKAMSSNEENQQGLQLDIDIEELEDIFGGGKISIRPTGFATLRLSLDRNRNDSEQLNIQQQNPPPFLNFQQDIQVGVIGQIGEKLRLNVNFDTQATFDFEDELKLAHKGTEDQIIQEIEAGNVSMQVGNSLMQGRQNLFGLKTKLRFGPVYVSGIASFERGQVETVRVAGGGAIETPFEKEVTEYDANRHFFLSHFFRSVYEDALDNLPVVQSRLQINQVEIWVERQGFTRNNRNAVGFLDLGENELPIAGGQGVVYNENIQSSTANSDRYPSNESNDLYDILENTPAARDITTTRNAVEGLSNLRMVNTEDFEVLGNMRRLEPNEYKINTKLGYVSLNTPLRSDQVLFVAYNYTLDGEVKQVGEFSNEIPVNQDNTNVLFLKMLRPSVTRVSPYPGWDLMMKNIYQIAFGIKQDDFFLDVRFETGTSAGKVNYLPNSPVDNKPLIQVLGVDNVTNNTAPGPDNYFDFINGYTVDTDKGTVIFPKLEPFGSHLEEQLANDPEAIENYVFDQLYRNTQASARQNGPQFRYSIEGYFRSAGNSEIPLNTFQLKEGGVIVTAGGRQLTEGQDYTVDYFGGKVIIINQSILNSGQEIEVSYENSQLYSLQTRRLLGSRAEYSPSKDLSLGLTILNLREQPINQKQILGQEPINNTLWGFDAAFNRESGFLTKAIDKLPLITTKAPSSFIGSAEFAQFLPGAPNQTKLRDQDGNVIDNGIVYLDDFESSTPPFTLMNTSNWFLASYPEGNPDVFDPRTVYNNPRSANYNRGKLAWYSIDQVFYNARANEVPDADQENNYTRKIEPTEIFPQASLPIGNIFQRTFDLRYDPRLRGPYNYQVDPTRVSSNGLLSQPDENWAGVMRVIDLNNDFEATNVEFIEFWMMDPFDAKDGNPFSDGGEMYFNLGLVSEEILPDGIVSRENALPSPSDPNLPIDSLSPWGKIPILTPLTETFVNNPEDRLKQDVGLDGLPTEEEVTFFSDVIDTLSQFLTPAALNRYETDPSSDNYTSYRDPELRDSTASILRRYFDFNGQDGNTPVRNSAQEENSNLSLQATSLPDQEDINRNGSLNFTEQYWQYRIRMNPDSLVPGQNFVVDTVRSVANIGRGQTTEVTWYQFRIPIRSGTAVNGISNFQSINFMRMYMTGFRDPVIMRMTEFQLVSSQWIRFNGELAEEGVVVTPTEANETTFELGQVSRERNSQKLPYNYVLPPGIIRQQLGVNTFSQQVEDERSLVMRVCKLTDGDARGMYKITRNDLRQYERLKMFVHAEPFSPDNGLTPSNFEQPGDAMVFIRLGLDNDQNYYEYEMPLSPSDPAFPNLRENVWLPENEFDIDLAAFAGAKSRRGTSFGQIYRYRDTVGLPEGHAIIIKGTPKLSDVRNIMVGVRNPEDGNTEPLCMEVWVNELRLTNFTQNSGVAAKFNGSATLADLATFRVNGQYKSAGFGPLEQKLSNRPQEEELRYDLEANVNVDKVFPKNWGMSLPVTVRYSRAERTPLFNPQEADVSVDRLLEALPRDTAQARLREIQDFKQTRSIALTNWRINPTQSASKKPGAKPKPKPKKSEGGGSKQKTKMPWSITNFNATYAYVETQARNATIASQLNTQHRGALGYRYNFPKVNVKPFAFISKVKPLNSTVGFLSKFAINPLPANVQVSVNGNRQFEERILRVIGDRAPTVHPQ